MRSIATVVLTIAMAGSATAQEHAGGGYAFGGIVSIRQPGPTGEAPQTYDTAPGGATIGWLIGIGAFVTPVASVEFEISSTGLMTAREPSRRSSTPIQRSRRFTTQDCLHIRLMMWPHAR